WALNAITRKRPKAPGYALPIQTGLVSIALDAVARVREADAQSFARTPCGAKVRRSVRTRIRLASDSDTHLSVRAGCTRFAVAPEQTSVSRRAPIRVASVPLAAVHERPVSDGIAVAVLTGKPGSAVLRFCAGAVLGPFPGISATSLNRVEESKDQNS